MGTLLMMNSLVLALAFSFLTVFIIYLVGGSLAAKGEETSNKSIAYASGEKLASEKIRINVETFFIYVVGFMIFDILAFVFVSFMASSNQLPFLYTGMVGVSSLVFLWMVKTQIREVV